MHISDKMKNGIATFQEIFNKEWQWFVIEKHPKCADDYQCLYRDESGNKCAVGLLVKRSEYKKRWDGEITIGIDVAKELGWNNKYDDFINSLQSLHDDCYRCAFTKDITYRLIEFAKESELEVPDVI